MRTWISFRTPIRGIRVGVGASLPAARVYRVSATGAKVSNIGSTVMLAGLAITVTAHDAVGATASTTVTATQSGAAPVTMSQDWANYNLQNGGGDFANPYMPIPFYAHQSPYNVGSLVRGTDYTTSVVFHPSTFPNNTVFTWSFPEVAASGHVYNFDSIDFGYNTGAPQTPIPAFQIQNLTTLTATTNYSLSGETQFFNIIYDFFVYPTSTPGAQSTAHEFSITLHCQNYEAAAVTGLASNLKFNYPDSQGTQWIIYDYGGGAIGSQIVIDRADFADVPNNYVIDIKGIINAAVAHGWVSANEWFVGIGLGAEPAQGNGSWTLNSWSFNYNGTIYP